MIEVLLPTIIEVAKYQQRAFNNENIKYEIKADKFDFVSEVDRRSQQMIVKAIATHFPASGIVAEEEGEDKPSQDRTWFLVDPLDGTANFKAGIPIWAISIGFIKDGVIEEGIISTPFTRETFYSRDFDPLVTPLENLAAAQFYGIDSTFENLELGLVLKRRQLGAAVPTLLWCCDSRYRQRARLDFALMGKGSFWDVCGAIAFLKQQGGSLIDSSGIDLTECSDVFEVLGGLNQLRMRNFCYVASASKDIAREIYQRYLHNAKSV